MQSINEQTGTPQTQELELVSADTLRDMTITPEELFDKQKQEILVSLMSSMVSVATQNGASEYAANLHPQFDPKLLEDIKTQLGSLGYTTESRKESAENLGEFISLVVSWKQ